MSVLQPSYCCISRLYVIPLLLAGLLMPAFAQVPTTITPDGSLGTTVTQEGNVFEITDRTQQGRNLFHSFDRFDVGTGDIARFTGPTTIENILSRVTGGQQSISAATVTGPWLSGASGYE